MPALVLGIALKAAGDLEAADAVLAPLAERALDAWAAQLAWGETLVALSRTREAVAPLARAVARNPGLAGAWRALGDIRLASGDVVAARGAYDRMLVASAADPRLRGAATDLADGRLAEAERALSDLLRQETQNPAAIHLLAEVLTRQGRFAPAADLFPAEGLAIAPPPPRRCGVARALALQSLARPLEALAELDAVLAREPRHARARMAKAASASPRSATRPGRGRDDRLGAR